MDKPQAEMNELYRLFQKILNNEATDQEKQLIAEKSAHPDYAQVFAEWLDAAFADAENERPLDNDAQQMILNAIYQSEDKVKSAEEITMNPARRYWLNSWVKVAAAILLVAGVGVAGALLLRNDTPDQITKGENIHPAQEGIVLTLSDGKKVEINERTANLHLEDAGVEISRSTDGMLVYKTVENDQNADSWNMISTGKGQSVVVELPDESRVWLNANSSMRYPMNMKNASQRNVEINGEAFFDVSKQYVNESGEKQRKPFTVKTARQLVTVLGTQFNISSYDKNITYTTLLEGSVEVTVENRKQLLKPGEQTIVKGEDISVVADVNIAQVTAWKNGVFYFDQYSIDQVLNEIQNWYDIAIEFKGEKTTEVFSGMIDRNKPLSELLAMLEKTNAVKFNVIGNKVYVLP